MTEHFYTVIYWVFCVTTIPFFIYSSHKPWELGPLFFKWGKCDHCLLAAQRSLGERERDQRDNLTKEISRRTNIYSVTSLGCGTTGAGAGLCTGQGAWMSVIAEEKGRNGHILHVFMRWRVLIFLESAVSNLGGVNGCWYTIFIIITITIVLNN